MFCPHCGRSTPDGSQYCSSCGSPIAAKGDLSKPPDGDAVAALIPYRNMAALFGYYLGVFSLIPCLGLPLGLAAVPCGIYGLRKHRREPTAKGKVHAWVAVILGLVSTILWGGLLAWAVVASL